MQANERDPRRAIRTLNIVGYATMLAIVGGVGGWAATSPLTGAVIAPGTIVVESNVKKVQHPTGGVVGQILIKEGDEVREGQVVMRLDDTVTRATLSAVQSQLDQFTARQARLLAERDGTASIVFPDELTRRRRCGRFYNPRIVSKSFVSCISDLQTVGCIVIRRWQISGENECVEYFGTPKPRVAGRGLLSSHAPFPPASGSTGSPRREAAAL